MTKFTITSEWGFIFAQALHQSHIDFTLSAKADGMTIEVKNKDFKKACEVIDYTRAIVLKGV